MKRIINGKLYDTEKATYLGSIRIQYYYKEYSDKDYYERLYKTKSGRYFIATDREDLIYKNGLAKKQGLYAVSELGAKRWAAINLSYEEYVAAFGVPDLA